MAKPKKGIKERFWAKVIKTEDCWFWIAAVNEFGHGKFTNSERRTVKAHRYSYELHAGPIPEGLVVRHMCNNPSCVNPDHLALGTQLDNIADQKHNKGKGRPKQIRLTKEEKIQRRFWTYVNKDGQTMPHMKSNCWEWAGGTKGAGGYGGYWNGKTNVIAPRYSYELTYGPIAEGNFICHKCDNPYCVRPDHLFEGTPSDNSRDRTQKGRQKGGPERGSRHHSSKLTEYDVIEIRQIWDSNTKNRSGLNKQLSERYGVSPTTISEIIHRKIWVHI